MNKISGEKESVQKNTREDSNKVSLNTKRHSKNEGEEIGHGYYFKREPGCGIYKDDKLIFGKEIIEDMFYYIGDSLIVRENPSSQYEVLKDGKLFYKGDINNNKLEGNGILYDTTTGKRVYEGEFKENKRNGNGRVFINDDDFYYASFENDIEISRIKDDVTENRLFAAMPDDLKNNQSCQYIEKFRMISTFEPLKLFSGYEDESGNYVYGILYYINNENSMCYEGSFKDGKYHGNGVFYSNHYLSFRGEFKEGKPIQGQICYDKCVVYNGEVNEKYEMHGKGRLYGLTIKSLRNGQQVLKYDGEFKNNKSNGFGKLYQNTDNGLMLQYCGYFKDNLFEGRGVYLDYSPELFMVGLSNCTRDTLTLLNQYTKEDFDADKTIMDCWRGSQLCNTAVMISKSLRCQVDMKEDGMYLKKYEGEASYSGKVEEVKEGGIDLHVLRVRWNDLVTKEYNGCKEVAVWMNGEQKGRVEFFSRDGNKYFEGICINYIPMGEGVFYGGNKDQISGQWKDGYLKEGKYTFNTHDGCCVFNGTFTEPISYKQGLISPISGQFDVYLKRDNDYLLKYSGDVKDNQYEGRGKMYYGNEMKRCEGVMAGCCVMEGTFKNSQFVSGLVRDCSKTKEGFTSMVSQYISISKKTFNLCYYENEKTHNREYVSYNSQSNGVDTGLFIENGHVRYGMKVNNKWNGDVYSYAIPVEIINRLLNNPSVEPVKLMNTKQWQWKRKYNSNEYTGEGEYYMDGKLYKVKEGTVEQNKKTVYTGGLKEIEQNGEYYCVYHGKGRLVDGEWIYEGEWKMGSLEGRCSMISMTNKRDTKVVTFEHNKLIEVNQYTRGDFTFSLRKDNVAIKYKDASLYNGGFIDREKCQLPKQHSFCAYPYVPHGTGRLFSNNRLIYKGGFDCGYRNGRGASYDKNGDLEYEGEWKYDMRNGKGIEYMNKQKVYDGMWENNMRNGEGDEIQNDKIVYHGQWNKNVKYGNGTEYDGDLTFEGRFSNQPYGLIIIKNKGRPVFAGEVKDHKPDKGVFYITLNDHQYCSSEHSLKTFLNNKKSRFYCTGDKNNYYEGCVKYDEKTCSFTCNGEGTWYNKDLVYTGTFKNNDISNCYVYEDKKPIFLGEIRDCEYYAGFVMTKLGWCEGLFQKGEIVSGYVIEKSYLGFKTSVKEKDPSKYNGLYVENGWNYREFFPDNPFRDLYPKTTTMKDVPIKNENWKDLDTENTKPSVKPKKAISDDKVSTSDKDHSTNKQPVTNEPICVNDKNTTYTNTTPSKKQDSVNSSYGHNGNSTSNYSNKTTYDTYNTQRIEKDRPLDSDSLSKTNSGNKSTSTRKELFFQGGKFYSSSYGIVIQNAEREGDYVYVKTDTEGIYEVYKKGTTEKTFVYERTGEKNAMPDNNTKQATDNEIPHTDQGEQSQEVILNQTETSEQIKENPEAEVNPSSSTNYKEETSSSLQPSQVSANHQDDKMILYDGYHYYFKDPKEDLKVIKEGNGILYQIEPGVYRKYIEKETSKYVFETTVKRESYTYLLTNILIVYTDGDTYGFQDK